MDPLCEPIDVTGGAIIENNPSGPTSGIITVRYDDIGLGIEPSSVIFYQNLVV